MNRPQTSRGPDRIPVILDTDIGNDIDDTWALVMLLRSPHFDVKLITTTDGQSEYRARILAKLLTIAGRTDIPIAMGPEVDKQKPAEREARFIADFHLANYGGKIEKDSSRAIIDTIGKSDRPVTIIAIGPLQTLAGTIDRDPSFVSRANLVGMQGSVFKGYNGSGKPDAEFNIKQSVPAAQKVLVAPWKSIAITPLDTCGLPDITLKGAQYQILRDRARTDALLGALFDSYAAWAGDVDPSTQTSSTLLYDTVAIYLADPTNRSLLYLQEHKISVTDAGVTVVSPDGKSMQVATSWRDVSAYRDYLVQTLLNSNQNESSRGGGE